MYYLNLINFDGSKFDPVLKIKMHNLERESIPCSIS